MQKQDCTFFKPTQVDSLIRKVEDTITELTISRESIATELATKKAEYEAIQNKDNQYLEGIKLEEETLAILVALKTGVSNQPVKVFRSLSNATAHKDRKPKGKNISWAKYAKDILATTKQPMFKEELMAAIKQEFGTEFAGTPTNTMEKAKYRLHKLAEANDQGFSLDTKGRIGLRTWFDKDGIILPAYLKM